jgi:hypothetical protein
LHKSRLRQRFPYVHPRSLVFLVVALASCAGLVAQDPFRDLPPSDAVAVFFPPPPTMFGAVVPEAPTRTSWMNGRPVKPSDEIADTVGESFYPPLATRVFDGKMSKKHEARLAAYRTSRATLVNELQDRLLELQDAGPAARERELRVFAEKQADRLGALEHEAEALRHDLVHGGLLGNDTADWNNSRAWHIGDKELAVEPHKSEGEFQVVRGAAYYQDGLGVEQRGLLRELAMELQAAMRKARRRPANGEDPAAMFFLPETARLKLPEGLPSDLIAKIARFNGEKSALKQELKALVLELDAASNGKRTRAFTALTERQWPRIRALETLGDEIRAGLAPRTYTAPPWLPPIPPELRARIEAFRADREALAKDLETILARGPGRLARFFDGPRTERALRDQVLQDREERMRRYTEALGAHTARVEELRQRSDQIRADLTLVAPSIKDPRGQPMTADSLLTAWDVAMERFVLIGREDVIYAHYKVAMLEPGLSPAQRRLLFGAAHAGLAQALPFGEASVRPASRPRPSS